LAGTLLAEVQSAEFENLQLELLNSHNDVTLSEQLLQELSRDGGNVSEQTIADAASRYAQNRQSFAKARSHWFAMGLDQATLTRLLSGRKEDRLPGLPIRSSIDGTIVHTDLSVGKIVAPNEHLFELVDLSKVLARIEVLEADLRHATAELPVELRLTAYPAQTIAARVQMFGLYLDPANHSNAIWAELQNPKDSAPQFLPGMTGQARVILPARKGSVLFGATALIDDGVDRYVWVEEAETPTHSQFRRQSVEVLRQTPELVECAAGAVFPGDRVLERGSQILSQSLPPKALRFSSEMQRSIGLETAVVSEQVIEEIAELEGNVELPPTHLAAASAPMGGTLQAIHVDRGQKVTAGTVLADILSLEMQNLQLDLLREHLELDLIDQQLQRAKAAGAAIPKRRLLDLQSSYNAARNRRDNVQNRLLAAGFDGKQIDRLLNTQQVWPTYPVKAPIDGTVAHFDKVLGQSIRADEPLFEIHNSSSSWLKVHVPELAHSHVRHLQEARVRLIADPTPVWTARVQRNSRIVSADSLSSSTWLEFTQAPPYVLRHGQLARVTLTLSKPEAVLAVPIEAVVRNGLLEYVFIANADGTFTRREISTGRHDDRWLEIRSGLRTGERIAVRGAAALQTAHAAVR
jgi:RND family efflux transporter MFP subunit